MKIILFLFAAFLLSCQKEPRQVWAYNIIYTSDSGSRHSALGTVTSELKHDIETVQTRAVELYREKYPTRSVDTIQIVRAGLKEK